MNFKDLLVKCLSSSDEVSFGRTMSAIAFISCILWDTFFVIFAAYKLDFAHMVIRDILPTSEQLQGQVWFCGACYGINKITEIFSAFSKR
jgi:hypothetical protein